MKHLLEKVYSYIHHFVLQRDRLFSSSQMPPQQGYMHEQRYASPEYREAPIATHVQPGYPQQDMTNSPQESPQVGNPQQNMMNAPQGYPQAGYPLQGYPQQRGGINPLVAGGLGAVGGWVAGYGLGQTLGGMQQDNGDRNGEPPLADRQEDSGDTEEDIGDIDSGDWDFDSE